MRKLYINSILMDIDDDTSIGVDIQAYNIKNPGQQKSSVTNAFSIPKTAHNLDVIGHAGNPQTQSQLIYNLIYCDYWIDNLHIINNSIVRIEEISNRIKLFVTYKNSIWETLKLVKWSDFVDDFLVYLHDELGYPDETNYDTETNFNTFLAPYASATAGLVLPMYFGNVYNWTGSSRETASLIVLSQDNSNELGLKMKGGHMCVFVKTIFEYIEFTYGVNFLTQVADVDGNIWENFYAPKIFVPIRDITIQIKGGTDIGNLGDTLGYYVDKEHDDMKFYPLENAVDKSEKSLHGLITGFMQLFNCIAEPIKYNFADAIFIGRFDDLETLAPVVDFSKNLSEITSFKPYIAGIGQENNIRFDSIYEEGNSEDSKRMLSSYNKNTEAISELFSIDAYMPKMINIGTNKDVPDLSVDASFRTFEFMYGGNATSVTIELSNREADQFMFATTTLNLKMCVLYKMVADYGFYEKSIWYPKIYTIKKWMSLADVIDLRFFAQYYIRQLNGSFFINKISGFNPGKSKEPTTIELMRISDKTPTPIYIDGYYIDGATPANIYVDGFGNYFY